MANAGLGYQGAQGAGLGDDETLTMADRRGIVQGLIQQGYTDSEISAIMGTDQGVVAAAAAEPEEPDRMSMLGLVPYGIRSGASQALGGFAGAAEDWFESDGFADTLEDWSEAVAPSDEQERRRAERAENKTLLGEVADMVVQEAGLLGLQVGAGAAAGSVVPGAGTTVGALAGAVIGIGRIYDQARQNIEDEQRRVIAEQTGRDPSEITDDELPDLTDDERARVTLAAVGGGAFDAFPAGKIVKMINPQTAMKITNKAVMNAGKTSVLKRGLKEAGKTGLQEGTIELAQEISTALLTDEELRREVADLPRKDILTLADHIRETRGREMAISFLTGMGLGGGFGGPAGARAQSLQNAQAKQDYGILEKHAKDRGLSMSQFEELAKSTKAEDQAKLRDTIYGLREAQLRRDAEANVAKEMGAEDLEAQVAAADKKLEGAVDAKLGALGLTGYRTGAQARKLREREEKERNDDAAARLREIGIDAKEGTTTDDLTKTADKLDELQAKVDDAREMVSLAGDAEMRVEAEKDLRDAEKSLRDERLEAESKLTGKTPEQLAKDQDRRRADDNYEKTVELQRQEHFTPEMTPEQRLAKVEELEARQEGTSETKGLEKQIAKKQRQLDAAETEEEFRERRKELEDLQSRRGRDRPLTEAIRREREAVEQELAGGMPPSEGAEGAVAEGALEGTPADYFEAAPDAVPLSALQRPESAPEGVDVTAQEMERARSEGAEGRPPIRVRQNEDGTYTVLSDPEAVAVAEASGWDTVPVEIVSETDVAAEAAPRVSETAGVEVTPTGEGGLQATGPSRLRQAAEDAAAAEGLALDYKVSEQIPANDRRHWGVDYGTRKYESLIDLVDIDAGIDAHEAFMREWTAETGFEAIATYDADGNLLGMGTTRDPNGVSNPRQGWPNDVAVMTHTHPLQTPLSAADMQVLSSLKPGTRMRAILPDGQVTEAVRSDEPMGVFDRVVKDFHIDIHTQLAEQLPNLGSEERAKLRQEALLRTLEEVGFIDYVTPLDGLTARQEETVNDLIDGTIFAEDSTGRGDDAGARTPEGGEVARPRPAGARAPPSAPRTAQGRDPDVVAAEEANVEDTPVDDATYAEQLARQAEEARVKTELVEPEFETLKEALYEEFDTDAKRRNNALIKGIEAGEITPQTLTFALQETFDGAGQRSMGILDKASRRLWPAALAETQYPKRVSKKRMTEIDKANRKNRQKRRKAMLQVWNRLSDTGKGKISMPEPFTIKDGVNKGKLYQRRNLQVTASMMRRFGVTRPQKTALMPPLEDPTDTSNLLRDPRNRTAGAALERATRTAEHHQAQRFTVDVDAARALTWEDLLSKSAKSQRAAMTPSEQNKQQKDAEAKLKRLQEAIEENGGAEVGFRYHIDKKGRIYPNGEFHHQTSDVIKGLFLHNGRSLAGYPSVDSTGSGMQIAAVLARDHTVAPMVNVVPQEGKGDIYSAVAANFERALRENPDPISQTFLENAGIKTQSGEILGNPDGPIIERNTWKTPVIAVNYAGGAKNFQQVLSRELTEGWDQSGREVKTPKGFFHNLAQRAYEATRETAPHLMAMQSYVIDGLKQAVGAYVANPDADPLIFTVGPDTEYTFLGKKDGDKEAEDLKDVEGKAIPRIQGDVYSKSDEIDIPGTARNIYSQMIQGFDAAIAHTTVEKFRETNGEDAFLVTNHDSFTVEPGNEAAIRDAFVDAMMDVLGRVDFTGRFRQEVLDQTGIDIGPFNNFGTYDMQSQLPQSDPAWIEGKGDEPDTKAPRIARAADTPMAETRRFDRGEYDAEADTAVGSESRIPARFPDLASSPENPDADTTLQVDVESMKAAPAAFDYNMTTVFPTYPGMGDLTGTADQITEAAIERMKDNLIWLYNNAPDVVRRRGRRWYNGARRVAETWADRYGLDPAQTAGVIASLSPQRDWFVNMTMAERTLDIMSKARDRQWNARMTRKWNAIGSLRKKTHVFKAIRGKTLQEVIDQGDIEPIAAWVRTFDETYNDRAYARFTPEGDLLPPTGAKMQWTQLGALGNAVSVILDGSPENISRRMGMKHKVRSFYNNIVTPDSSAQDVTIDTHAVAAALVRPLSQSSREVNNAFGSAPGKKDQGPDWMSVKKSGISGSSGLYALYADAYRAAAAEIGILPREMQSITWEAVRLLYPDVMKRSKPKLREIDDIWRGDGTVEEKRNAAEESAGSFGEPAWDRPDGDQYGPEGNATYEGELSGAERVGRDAGRRGARGRDSGAVPAAGRRQRAAGGDLGDAAGGGPRIAAGFDTATQEPDVRQRGAGRADYAGEPRAPREGETVAGLTPTQVYEFSDGRNVYEVADPQAFTERAQAALDEMGPVAAQVDTSPGERQFLFDDGNSGFALDGDNLITAFSSPNSPDGVASRIFPVGVAEGGRRLDGFNTFLPDLYARNGFRAVARLPFNREYAPTREGGAGADWDYGYFEQEFGTGEPDVVFMVYDPENASATTDNIVTDYDAGIEAQDAALAEPERRIAAAMDTGGATRFDRSPTTQVSGRELRRRSARGTAGAALGASPEQVSRPILERTTKSPAARMKEFRHEHTDYDNQTMRANLRDGETNGLQYKALVNEWTENAIRYVENLGLNRAARRDALAEIEAFRRDHSNIRPGPSHSTPKGKKILQIRIGKLIAEGKWSEGDFLEFGYTRVNARKLSDQMVGMHRKFEVVGGEIVERETPLPPIPRDRMSGRVRVAAAVDTPSYIAIRKHKTAGDVYQAVTDHAKDPMNLARTLSQALEDKIFNRFAPIRRLEEHVRGSLGEGAESAFKNAEMAVNDSGRAEHLLNYGAIKLGQYGEVAHAEGTVGLRTVFDTASGEGTRDQRGQNIADWASWMLARRAQDLHAKNIKTPLTDADIQDALAKEQPQFQEAADQWKAHNDANLQYLVDTGRISQAQADVMKADAFYVPFYRDAEIRVDGSSPDLDLSLLPKARGPRAGGELMSRNPGIKKMIGGDVQAIEHPLKTMIRNSQAMAAAGARNHAANMTFDLMTEAGLVEVRSKKSGNKPLGAQTMYRNGREFWAVPTDDVAMPVMVAMAGLQPLQLGRFMSVLAGIGAIFRQGITLSPAFMIRNAIRGAVSTGLLTSAANLTTQNNTFTGFRDALRRGDATKAFTRMSGMGDFRFGNPDAGFGQNDILIDYGILDPTPLYRMRQLLEKSEHVGSATELADRVAAYNTMIANDIRPDEAAYQALTIMNYSRKGSSPELRALLPTVPFLNARLQGLSRLTEGAVGRRGAAGRKQAMMQLALNGLILSAISAALWARNAMDEERNEKWKNEPLHRKLNYHVVYFGDKTLLIPKAFELGHLFSTLPELFLDGAVNEMGHDIAPGIKKLLSDTVGFNVIPTAALPIIEYASNYSFFTQRPIEGLRESDLIASDRVQGASAFSRFIGQQLGLSDATKISPSMFEHFFQGYGGTYYLALASALDMVGAELGLTPAQPHGAFGDMPVASAALNRIAGSMFKNTDEQSTRYIEEFYRTSDHVNQIYNSARAAALNGDVERAREILARAPAAPAAYKLVNRATRSMGSLNAQIRQIRANPSMSAAQKRRKLAPLIKARNKLSREVTNVLRKLEDEQGGTFRRAA